MFGRQRDRRRERGVCVCMLFVMSGFAWVGCGEAATAAVGFGAAVKTQCSLPVLILSKARQQGEQGSKGARGGGGGWRALGSRFGWAVGGGQWAVGG